MYNQAPEAAAPHASKPSRALPAYPNRTRGFTPNSLEDFGDGGAYPEIHVAQYPLNMGKPGIKSSGSLKIDMDSSTGMVRYDAIARGSRLGSGNKQLVQTTLKDMKEKRAVAGEVALPETTEEDETAMRTQRALEAILTGKVKKDGSIEVNAGGEEEKSNYVRYTPNPQAPGYTAAQRVIKVVEAQVDPLEPPKHKIKKAPFKPDNEAAPVLHKNDKITVAEHKAWKIPPVISNWKNESGFVIELDKRLAADGRGNAEVTINDKFAALSEALYISERKAGEDLKLRNDIRRQMAMQEKDEKEAGLRELAARARRERAGIVHDDDNNNNNSSSGSSAEYNTAGAGADAGDGAFVHPRGRQSNMPAWMAAEQEQERAQTQVQAQDKEQLGDESDAGNDADTASEGEAETWRDAGGSGDEDQGAGDVEGRRARDKLREEKKAQRLREMRGGRKGKQQRDEGRDISEKIALGQHTGKGGGEGEATYDNRLFNQSEGISSGFGADDSYDAYSKPMFDQSAARSAIYRPKADEGAAYGTAEEQLEKLQNTNRFRADKGFAGAEGGNAAQAAGPRSEPVQFEKAATKKTARSDVFDIGALVEGGEGAEPKRARRE
jgi:SNW domain-containing protein 1